MSSGKVRVAIVGVGNCAASLVQGVHYYRDADPAQKVPGLMHVQFGKYRVRDVEFVAAFDVDAKKVGRDLAEAITASENNTISICDVPPLGVTVQRGPTLDGLGEYYRETIAESDEAPVDVVQVLRDAQVDVLVSYLPVGSEQATKWYVEQILRAGCAFVNCVPVFIGREAYWQERFRERGLPVVGDDIKSQVGATIVHRQLARLMRERGVKLAHTSQLNFGGNTDFLNMLERERLESKKISKTNAVTSMMDYEIADENIHVGPSDYVPWLKDRKWCHIRIEGTTFGDVPLNAELKLEVWDSPNSAGVIIDAIRESRKIFQRMISYSIYRIAETIALLGFLTLAILIFRVYPVTAIMIVVLAILNDGAIPSIAYDNVRTMDKPERWNMREVMGIATILGGFAMLRSFGVFAIGDTRRGSIKRVATAVGDGAAVAAAVRPDDAEAFHFCGHIWTTGSCPTPRSRRRSAPTRTRARSTTRASCATLAGWGSSRCSRARSSAGSATRRSLACPRTRCAP